MDAKDDLLSRLAVIIRACRKKDALCIIQNRKFDVKDFVHMILVNLLGDCHDDKVLDLLIMLINECQKPVMPIYDNDEFQLLAMHEKGRFIANAYIDKCKTFMSVRSLIYVICDLKRYDLVSELLRQYYGRRQAIVEDIDCINSVDGFRFLDDYMHFTNDELLTYMEITHRHGGFTTGDRSDILKWVIDKIGVECIAAHSEMLNYATLYTLCQCVYMGYIERLASVTPITLINNLLNNLLKGRYFSFFRNYFIVKSIYRGIGERKQIILERGTIETLTKHDNVKDATLIIQLLYKMGARFNYELPKYTTAVLLDDRHNIINKYVGYLVYKRAKMCQAYKIVLSYAHTHISWCNAGILNMICQFIGHVDILCPNGVKFEIEQAVK